MIIKESGVQPTLTWKPLTRLQHLLHHYRTAIVPHLSQPLLPAASTALPARLSSALHRSPCSLPLCSAGHRPAHRLAATDCYEPCTAMPARPCSPLRRSPCPLQLRSARPCTTLPYPTMLTGPLLDSALLDPALLYSDFLPTQHRRLCSRLC